MRARDATVQGANRPKTRSSRPHERPRPRVRCRLFSGGSKW